MIKYCSQCHKGFAATTEYFYADKSRKDGLSHMCKVCKAEENKLRTVKPEHRPQDIYRTYYRTACNNPVKHQMLADFYDITVKELNQIIKTEDEKMAYRKWTDADNEQLLSLADIGKTKEELAVMFGTSPHNIENRILKLRKAQKPTIDPTPLEEVDPVGNVRRL